MARRLRSRTQRRGAAELTGSALGKMRPGGDPLIFFRGRTRSSLDS